ncbi:MAG: CDP-alcohol phosphatidyltransferase family protein [Rhodospirillaceae bacterium]|nr:CDP-alcohol phosphatidyltransferase family protein [Rhodospirillaceae bacterium]
MTPDRDQTPAIRLIVDRESRRGFDPETRILGVSVSQRTVKAAHLAGIETVYVLASSTVSGLQDDKSATILMPGDVLPEKEWLIEAAGLDVADGEQDDLGTGVRIIGLGRDVEAVSAVARRVTLSAGPILPLRSSADVPAAEDRLMSRLGKKTDGFMSRHVARPISMWVSRRVAPWPVTPNHMTLVSMMLGLVSAPFFLSSVWWIQSIGGLLFVVHSVLDGCDGELARLKFAESRLGGLLDFWSDNIVHFAVFGCMGIGWVLAVGHWWPLWVGMVAVAGAGGSAWAVYWVTLRRKEGDGPLYTSVSGGPGSRASRILDSLSRRDFIYLVLALALFGKAHWFLALTAIGAPFFLVVLLVVLRRDKSGVAG